MDSILFILSFVMLFLGGEFLVKSSVAIALKMRISTLVVGMTVVSFATSAPELFVSIKSALAGEAALSTFIGCSKAIAMYPKTNTIIIIVVIIKCK